MEGASKKYFISTERSLWDIGAEKQPAETFETFDQTDEEAWPDQEKTNTNTNTKTMTNTFREHLQRAILNAGDLWPLRHLMSDVETFITQPKTKYKYKDLTWLVNLCEIVDISESWYPEFMTIIVTWQLRVTLDSIRNSCDVFKPLAFACQVFPVILSKVHIKEKLLYVCFQVSQTIVFAIGAITVGDHLPEITRHFQVLPSSHLPSPPILLSCLSQQSEITLCPPWFLRVLRGCGFKL